MSKFDRISNGGMILYILLISLKFTFQDSIKFD